MDPTESLGLLGSKEDVLLFAVTVASPTSSATPRESSTHFEIEIIEKAIDSSLVPAFEFSVMEFQKILGDLGSPEATSLEHWKTLTLTQKNGFIYIAKVTAQTVVSAQTYRINRRIRKDKLHKAHLVDHNGRKMAKEWCYEEPFGFCNSPLA
jgi:hypothetical protein